MEKVSDHLFWVRHTCSVYGVVADGFTMLIDCGTHFFASPDMHVSLPRVEQVLLTHFHRDQCAAAEKWSRQGATIVIPFAERRFLEESDLQRAAYDIYDNYTSYYPCFGPLRDVDATDYAHDYETLRWRGFSFAVIPLPGHTFGSVGYLFEVDGARVLACGDLVCGPGRLRDYYWCQWRYMDFQGHVNLLESLEVVAGLGVDLILPGHGAPFEPDERRFQHLRDELAEIWELFHNDTYEPFRPKFRQLSQHVWEISNVQACPYIVTDGEGNGLFIDCGYTSNVPIGGNPHRFIDRLTRWLEPELGLRRVEYFLPTHYHDDHLAGYPALKARYGTRIVASSHVRDLLSHPERYDMPCAVPLGFELDEAVEPGAFFEWRGVRFFIEPHPGQTLYDQHIRFEVDDRTYLAIGDAVSGASFREKRDYIHSFIPKNRTPLNEYESIPRNIGAPTVLTYSSPGTGERSSSTPTNWRGGRAGWSAGRNCSRASSIGPIQTCPWILAGSSSARTGFAFGLEMNASSICG